MDSCAPQTTMVAILSLDCMYAECLACAATHPTKDIDAWSDMSVTNGRNPIQLYSFSAEKLLIFKVECIRVVMFYF